MIPPSDHGAFADESAVPDITVDGGQLEQAARALRTSTAAFATGLAHVQHQWGALPHAMSSPGAIDALYSAMQPAATAADDLQAAADAGATALETLAQSASTLQQRAAGLRGEIAEHRRQAAEALAAPGASTQSVLDGPVGTAGANLLADCRALAADWSAAEQEAAAALDRVLGGTGLGLPLVPDAAAARAPKAAAKDFTGTTDAAVRVRGLAAAAERGPAALRAYLEQHPGAAGDLAGVDAHSTAPWWKSLSPAAQSALIAVLPAVVGNLDGVDYRSRDTANRAALAARIAAVRAEQARAARPAVEGARSPLNGPLAAKDATELQTLLNIQAALTTKFGVPRSLVSFSGEYPPLAAVAVGDLAIASSITMVVPGMNASTQGSAKGVGGMAGLTNTAQTLHDREAIDADAGTRPAVIAWIGYRTPSPLTVLSDSQADQGAPALRSALVGLRAVTGDDTAVNVVAHSYGTTTTATALHGGDARADTVVFLGSAGMPGDVTTATDLKADHVFAIQARNVLPFEPTEGDEWAEIGRSLGRLDPTEPGFGATVLAADGLDGAGDGTSTEDHGLDTTPYPWGDARGYLSPGTEGLRNTSIALVQGGEGAGRTRIDDPTSIEKIWYGPDYDGITG